LIQLQLEPTEIAQLNANPSSDLLSRKLGEQYKDLTLVLKQLRKRADSAKILWQEKQTQKEAALSTVVTKSKKGTQSTTAFKNTMLTLSPVMKKRDKNHLTHIRPVWIRVFENGKQFTDMGAWVKIGPWAEMMHKINTTLGLGTGFSLKRLFRLVDVRSFVVDIKVCITLMHLCSGLRTGPLALPKHSC
jgi:hypothetical protein